MKNDAEKIRKLIAVLRGRRGCAWDRLQTPKTLVPLLIEEAYEVIEAVEEGDRGHFLEEIGDLLFLVLSIIAAAESKGPVGDARSRRRLAYTEIIDRTVRKYVVRHPHVFHRENKITPAGSAPPAPQVPASLTPAGSAPPAPQVPASLTPAGILAQWERQKAKNIDTHPLDSISIALPALYQAKRVYEKASRLKIVGVRKRAKRMTAKKIAAGLLRLVRRAVENGIDPETALRSEVRTLRRVLKKRMARVA